MKKGAPQIPPDLELRMQALEGRYRRLQMLLAVCAALGCLWMLTGQTPAIRAQSSDILRVRGLIIEDENGRERILLGAPIPKVGARRRSDPVNGLVVLGEKGVDRVAVAYPMPSPQIGGRVNQRVAAASGISFNDQNGNERGGLGAFDDGRVTLGLDYENGAEAITFAVDSAENLARISVRDRNTWIRGQLLVHGATGARLVGMNPLADGRRLVSVLQLAPFANWSGTLDQGSPERDFWSLVETAPKDRQ